ncbi:MAG: S41 family peptidase [Pseudomonadota bacterium]
MKITTVKKTLIAFLLLYVLISSCTSTSTNRYSASTQNLNRINSYQEEKKNNNILPVIYDYIIKYYPVEVNNDVIINGALKGLKQKLGADNFRIIGKNKNTIILSFDNSRLPNSRKEILRTNPKKTISDIYESALYFYPDTTSSVLIQSIADGMLSSLDPHSSYLNPADYQELKIGSKGSLTGVGIEISIKDDVLTVVSPIEGSPAQVAGLKSGDKIIKIDNVLTRGMSLIEAVRKIRGPTGSKVTLSIQRDEWTNLEEITIARRSIAIQSVKSKIIDGKYGYIRINYFQANTSNDFKNIIDNIAREKRTKGIIIDLRNNPGGLLNQVVKTTDFFLDSGTIVFTKSRVENLNMTFNAHQDNNDYKLPVIILVNSGTASGAEIFAAALQDYKKAFVIGERTFGKGTVQTIYPLEDGSAIKLTTAKYITPNGNEIQQNGIIPDLTLLTEKNVVKKREENLQNSMLNEYGKTTGEKLTILIDSSKEDPMIELATEIFKKSSSASYVDLLLSAKQIAAKSDNSLAKKDSESKYTETLAALRTTDNQPPDISVYEPLVKRGVKIIHKDKTLLVKGKLTDESSIYEVFINGVEASLSEDGEFWAKIKLGIGENNIKIKAADIYNNVAERSFVVSREIPTSISSTKRAETQLKISDGKYFALIIAVEDYLSQELTDLDNPVKDAKALHHILTANYSFKSDNTILLLNPNRTKLIEAFDKLSQVIGPDDNLLIFYAGHGYWDERFRQGYWLPSDASKNNRAQWVSNSTIRDFIRGINTKHTLLITDACFSGGIFKTRSAFKESSVAIQKLYTIPSRKAITSGTLNEVPDRSVFVEFLLKRLSDNSKKYLSSEELFSSFRQAVINNSPVNQIPQFGEIREAGDEGGDFIFFRK